MASIRRGFQGRRGGGLGGGENSFRREREGSETAMARWTYIYIYIYIDVLSGLAYILMCEALPPTLSKEYTEFAMRWYSACKHGSKKHRKTGRNAAHFFVWVSCSNRRNEDSASN